MIPRIALTPGEPAGIGPDLVARLAADGAAAELVAIGDPQLIAARARQLGIQLELLPYQRGTAAQPSPPGHLLVDARPLRVPAQAGRLDAANSGYVLDTLNRAATGCLAGEFAAMVTAPVHKGVINDAGIAFSGHTEYLAGLTGAAQPVMLLVAGSLRVALLTTHLPLRAVPDAITGARIEAVARVLHDGLVTAFGIARPRIAVLGLNPHAGESGHLGNEEQSVIGPALARLRSAGLAVQGPLPADSAFTPAALAQCDAVLAMYHDQGLPVLKHAGFGHAVNLTLGLPILRTSVDHGTALELAGSGRADAGSLHAALALAIDIARRRRA